MPVRWPDSAVGRPCIVHFHGGTPRRRLQALCLAASVAGADSARIAQAIAENHLDLLVGDTRLLSRFPPGAESADSPPPVPGWKGIVVSAGAPAPPRRTPRLAGGLPDDPPLNLPIAGESWQDWKKRNAGPTTFLWALNSFAAQAASSRRRYARFLAEQGSALPGEVARQVAAFRDLVRTADPDFANCLLLTAFSRLHASAMMAGLAGVLPLTADETTKALASALMAARRTTGYSTVTVLGLQRRLRDHLRSENIVRDQRGQPPPSAEGFWRTDGADRIYTVRFRAVNAWFPNPAERVALLLWLHRAGHLCAEQAPRPAVLPSTDWAKRYARWPDGDVWPSYVFREPAASPRRGRIDPAPAAPGIKISI